VTGVLCRSKHRQWVIIRRRTTMADERVVSDIITKFFLNTCRLCPQLSRPVLEAAVQCAAIATLHPINDTEADFIPSTTGSAAEFYIEPMLPHVGDVDVMYYYSTLLAIPRGHTPPTQLPVEFSNYVKVHEIVDSHLPGYVYLELRYLLTECINDDKYNCFEYDRDMYLPNAHLGNERLTMHGPALVRDNSRLSPMLSVDLVLCVRCLSWPSQAADWPTRHRNYNWPDSATVDRVVSNRCDVVGVAHRQYRQHEWMGVHQWRLSFSRAEIVLINSWMPVQQIVYHMLRYFMKTKRLIDSADDSGRLVVSNYHIKTLMMWASELKPRSWWTDGLNVMRICVELLHTLSVCLSGSRCSHYFINNCNLVDSSLSVGTVATELMSVDKAYLSTWFVNNYIGECARLCPDYVPQFTADANNVIDQLRNAVSVITQFRLNTSLIDLWSAFEFEKYYLSLFILIGKLDARSCVYFMNALTTNDCGLYHSEFFTAIIFLHIAYKIPKNGFNDNLNDVLATLLGQLNRTPRHSKQHCGVLFINRATKLMKVVANKFVSTVQLIEIELSKAYLYRALRCKDHDSDSIYCLANVYLAVLYYTTGQYQTAIDHCILVTRSQDHSQCSSHVVQGELLPKIDDDIDNILGLTVFYQYVLSVALSKQQRQHVSIFTTEMFAYYLHGRLLSVPQCPQVTQMSPPAVGQRCAKCISEMNQLYIGDVLVAKSLDSALEQNASNSSEWSKCDRSSVSKRELNTLELVNLLQQSAVEHLTTYRQLQARLFSSVATIVTTDFEALYAYKHGEYQRCLQLSTQNVCTLLYGGCMTDIPAFPEVIQLLDDDIVSLTALILIVDPECRDDSNNAYIDQLTLSLYLMTQCQLRLPHSVASLAQTLDHIKVAERIYAADRTLDHLTLKLAKFKTRTHLQTTLRD